MSEPYTLQSHEAAARWAELLPLLERIELIEIPLPRVREMVANREAQVWCLGTPVECVCLTKIEGEAPHKFGLIWMVAGDLRVMDYLPMAEAWMRSQGCRHVQLVGRRGWKKILPDYREQSVTLIKDL